MEDSAAVTGLLIALAGVFASTELNNPYFDGSASILIGLLLLAVASFLARETKGLLMGEPANPEILERIADILKNNKGVNRYLFPKSIHLGPESILVVIKFDLEDDLKFSSAKELLAEIRHEIKQRCPRVTHIFFQGMDVQE